MKRILVSAIVSFGLLTNANAVNVNSRKMFDCANIDEPGPRARCFEHVVACHARLKQNYGNFWHKGNDYEITGGSTDPHKACQHGGDCLPLTVLIIPSSCKRVGTDYFSWERK